MTYKIGVFGASGRMGLEIAALCGLGFWIGEDCLELTMAVSQTGKLKSIEGVPVSSVDELDNDPVHCWIDFSRPAGTMQLLQRVSTPVMVGTTGFSEEELKRISNYAKDHPVVMASNTSLGMNQMIQWLRTMQLSPHLGFDAVLWEEHHIHKKDSPSGTAKSLLKELAAKNIPVQVMVSRAGGTKGVHSVRFVSEDEELEIIHRVNDRKIFAKGALLAAHYLCRSKQNGLSGMEEVFSFSGDRA